PLAPSIGGKGPGDGGPSPAPGIEYWRIFRARMFDNRRTVNLNGRAVNIESAARFNSQIPLEYPYAAWGKLPLPKDGQERRLLAPFLPVTRALIVGFMAHRLRALRHIEGRLTAKNSRLGKRPLNLAALAFQALGKVSLARAVEEFLFIEHHTTLQTLLLDWSRPVEERARRGQAMLLECRWAEPGERGALRVGFRLRCDLVGMDPALALHQLTFKDGDWVVVNREEDDQRPRKMLHGRLGIIRRLAAGKDGGPEAVIELLTLSFLGGKFRTSHDTALQPAPGERFVVDTMADDLNGDKFLAACRAAVNGATPNPLLAAITAGPDGNGLPVAPERARQMAAALAAVQAASPAPLTAKQQEVIAGGLDQRVRLVQGPPGTGKSHTLGWAVPAQMAAARRAGAPAFRVAVTAKTHTAVNIALASIRDKAAALRRAGGPLAAALDGLRIVKLGGDEDGGNAPPGIEPFNVYRPAGVLRELAEGPLTVVGGTPGGLYNLLSRGYDRQSMWAVRPFDLLVADEASQMNLPEAVTAAAFVKPDGRLLIVGDHRQMAPIVAHNWDQEERRSVKDAEVYRSLFAYLLDRGFPSVALDRSFRLHRDLAAFLAEIIYQQDGVNFHSVRADRLPPIASADPLVQAALDPAYPVVVIEHDEASSQQFNTFEGEIVARLLRALTDRRGLGLDGAQGVGVVAPHRAQRALLQAQFPELAAAGAIDTVERFQGGEREVIIVSATASDPNFVLGEAEFLLDPKRLNVALSRPRRKLIVVAARTVFRLICADLEVFEHATLWKRLRYGFTDTALWDGEVAGVGVRVLGRRAEG
ncbi:MAG: ATP-binding protein, partial [Chloroflexi bacterium]|nr:ATP-binding protein [Chloroflexota bacterium]